MVVHSTLISVFHLPHTLKEVISGLSFTGLAQPTLVRVGFLELVFEEGVCLLQSGGLCTDQQIHNTSPYSVCRIHGEATNPVDNDLYGIQSLFFFRSIILALAYHGI